MHNYECNSLYAVLLQGSSNGYHEVCEQMAEMRENVGDTFVDVDVIHLYTHSLILSILVWI